MISNYWFESGTPTFLINQIKERDDIQVVTEPVIAGADAFIGYEIDRIEIVPLLFQTGYLTVKSVARAPVTPPEYTLGIPNAEVHDSLMVFLVSGYANYPTFQTNVIRLEMQKQIRACDSEGFAKSLHILLANIPYSLHIGKEKYYHSLFLSWIKMLGFEPQSEVMTNIGRIDAVWQQPGLTVIAEIKYHATKKQATLLREAMKQIHDRKYFEKYHPNKVLLLAVAFTGQEVGCKMVVND
jgi:hypothetical protein